MLAKEEMKLAPIIVPASGIVGVLEGVHGDASWFVARDDFCDEEAVAHIFAIILDGVGEIKSLHPL